MMLTETNAGNPGTVRAQRALKDLVIEQAEKLGDRTFLIFENTEHSFQDIHLASNRLAKGLEERGISKGDKVAVALPNSPTYVHAIFGLAKLGAVQVSVNTGLRGASLLRVLNHSDAEVVIVAESFLEHIEHVASELERPLLLVVCGSDSHDTSALPFRIARYEEIVENDGIPSDVAVGPADPLAIFYTSGTTGPAKGVVLPNNFSHWQAAQRIRLLELTPDDRWYTCLPLFHVNAQFVTLISSWVAGSQVVLAARFSASRFWEDIRRYKATGFNAAAAMPLMLLNQPPDPKDGQHNLRAALMRLSPEKMVEFEHRFGVRCIQSFGMTECTPVLMEPLDASIRPSMGRAIVDREVRVVDENDVEVSPGIRGEMVFRPRTPNSMIMEYYKQPEATLEAMRNLWFHTGDLVYRDDKGNFFYVERKKDSIRRRGENISSFEVESVVKSHPSVEESAAIPVPSELGEDEVKVVVKLEPGSMLEHEDLIAYCEPRLPTFALPRYVEFVEEFPRTQATLRIEKYKLRQDWQTARTWDRLASRT